MSEIIKNQEAFASKRKPMNKPEYDFWDKDWIIPFITAGSCFIAGVVLLTLMPDDSWREGIWFMHIMNAVLSTCIGVGVRICFLRFKYGIAE